MLDGGDGIEETIRKMILANVDECIAAHTSEENPENWDFDGLRSSLMYLCTEDDFRYTDDELKKLKRTDIEDLLEKRALKLYSEKEELFGLQNFLEIERAILLQNVDRAWMEHIDAMDDLKDTIGLQAYAQRDPVTEYRIVGGDMFDAMVSDIRGKTVRMVLSVVPRPKQEFKRVQVAKPMNEGFEGGEKKPKKVVIRRESSKIGRNEPCPCGSGKKYKNCCGAAANNVNRDS